MKRFATSVLVAALAFMYGFCGAACNAVDCIKLEYYHCSDWGIAPSPCIFQDCENSPCGGKYEYRNINETEVVSGYRAAFTDEQGSTSYTQAPVVCTQKRACGACVDYGAFKRCGAAQGDWIDYQTYYNMTPSGATCWGI